MRWWCKHGGTIPARLHQLNVGTMKTAEMLPAGEAEWSLLLPTAATEFPFSGGVCRPKPMGFAPTTMYNAPVSRLPGRGGARGHRWASGAAPRGPRRARGPDPLPRESRAAPAAPRQWPNLGARDFSRGCKAGAAHAELRWRGTDVTHRPPTGPNPLEMRWSAESIGKRCSDTVGDPLYVATVD